MKFKKPNPREMIVIGISILLLYQFTIRLIFEKSSTQELILQFSFFTIGCILAVLLREFFTLLHEFGHVISLHLISFFNKCIIINYRVKCTITKESTYPLRYKTTSNIDDYLCGFYGKTYSPLYYELTLPLIKLNAIMGYVFELVLFVTLIIIGTIKLYISPSILLDPYVFVFTFDSVFLFLVSMYFALIKGTSDTTYFKYPDTFSYSDKTTKISKTYTRFNIAYYLLVTLVYTLISSFNSIL